MGLVCYGGINSIHPKAGKNSSRGLIGGKLIGGEIYKLTKLGRKVAGSVVPGKRDGLLDYLYTNRTASIEELAQALGQDRYGVKAKLRELVRRGLVIELTGREGI